MNMTNDDAAEKLQSESTHIARGGKRSAKVYILKVLSEVVLSFV